MCPVCTVTVIAGLGISRLLGIDDVVTSVWIGGLILSLSFWTLNIAGKKGWFKKITDKNMISAFKLLIIVLMYFLVLIPLKAAGSIGIPGNQIFGIDKILFGTIMGTIFFLIGIWADKKERSIRGKQLIKFQKVVFPVSSLIISSAVLNFII